MEAKKIQKILPLKLCIRNAYTYQNFIRRKYKFCYAIEVRHRKPNIRSSLSEESRRINLKLLKLLKNVKYVKDLQLRLCSLWSDNNQPARSIAVAKLAHYIKSLSFFDNLSPQKWSLALEFWLKYLKQLRRVDYILGQHGIFAPGAEELDYADEFKKVCQRMKVAKIDSLGIKMFAINPSALTSLLTLTNYASCTKSLVLHSGSHLFGGIISTPHLEILPSHLLSLRSLRVHISQKFCNLAPYIESIFTLSNLRHLNLSFDLVSKTHVTDAVSSPLKKVQNLHHLEKFKLSVNFWSDDAKDLFQAFAKCPLKYFGLTIQISHENELPSLPAFINQLKELTNLKLCITTLSQPFSQELLQNLFAEVSNLAKLRSLKLCFLTKCSIPEEHYFSNLVESFQNLFTKAIPLQKYSFKCNSINSNTDFIKLISYVNNQASSLSKLKIDIGEYVPQRSDYNSIADFIRALKLIRVLNLNSLSITCNQLLNEILDSILNLKYLSILSLGKMNSISKNHFVDTIESILSKMGLQKFHCKISRDMKQSYAATQGRIIDVDRLIKKNPLLEEIPQELGIFVETEEEFEEWPKFLCIQVYADNSNNIFKEGRMKKAEINNFRPL